MSSLPVSAPPLDQEQTRTLHSVVDQLSPDQLQWVSGYVAGIAAVSAQRDGSAAIPAATMAPAANSGERLTILFGSQTGNGEAIAAALARDAEAAGFAVQLTSLADFKPSSLKRQKYLSFVVSTHGEGDPPDDAELFREYLLSEKAPRLDGLRYSVLALGDSSYVNFCQTGREFDTRLAELGAERFSALIECDLDYEEPAAKWSQAVLDALPDLLQTAAAPVVPKLRAVEATTPWSKSNPYAAEVLTNQKITGGGSSKDVRHIELSLEGSGLAYEPGDSLAVVADNPPQLVDLLLSALGLDATAEVVIDGATLDLGEALLTEREITALNLGFLKAWAEVSDSEPLRTMLQPDSKQALADFIEFNQLIDVVRTFPADVDAQQFVDMLRPLTPRSYSIASSLTANPDEVHLTVAAVRYQAHGSEHWGAASTYLADRADVGDKVRVFVEPNSRFRLPAADVPAIMIGPGTGVAPFRAFVEERIEQGVSADNWLFFGDRNFDSDFLYQLEWQRYLKQGHLTRLDVAFSRDQRRKVYVQDRIREHAVELYAWLQRGAAIYVCGDAKHMAPDVHEALIDVIAEQGELDRDAAEQQLKALRQAGRYQRDVY